MIPWNVWEGTDPKIKAEGSPGWGTARLWTGRYSPCLSVFFIAAALYNITDASAHELLNETCQISSDEPCGSYIMAFYEKLKNSPKDFASILKMIDRQYNEIRGPVI